MDFDAIKLKLASPEEILSWSQGVVCDKCGVEVTRSIVRRERMGHISLAAPIAHIWFFHKAPSKLSLLLDIPLPKLGKVIYYAVYVIVSVNEENKKRVLAELEQELGAKKKSIEIGRASCRERE